MKIEKNLPLDCSDVEILNSRNQPVSLGELARNEPLLVVIYPGDFTPVCTKQLCEYRDHFSDLKGLGVKMIGLSADDSEKHAEFKKKFNLPFDLYTDPQWKASKALGCTSSWMLGMVSRSIGLVVWNKKKNRAELVFREVEKLAVTRMSAKTLQDKIRATLSSLSK